jgi:uncharacterized iron-regulated membrane protein
MAEALRTLILLIILAATGCVIACEDDYDHWLYPKLWHVQAQPQRLTEDSLTRKVEQSFAPARVAGIRFSGRERRRHLC